MCTPKRRALQKNEKRIQLAYQTFVRFYQLSANFKGVKTYEDFCESPYYNAFCKFGSFLNNVKPLYPDKYIDYIITSGIKIDKWIDESVYEKYVVDLIIKEGVETAIERSIKTMIDWAEKNNSVWNHYFNYVSVNRATFDIKDGKISPWLLLNSKSGLELLSKFNDEQLAMIYPIVNPEHWAIRFNRHKSDVELAKSIAEEANL